MRQMIVGNTRRANLQGPEGDAAPVQRWPFLTRHLTSHRRNAPPALREQPDDEQRDPHESEKDDEE